MNTRVIVLLVFSGIAFSGTYWMGRTWSHHNEPKSIELESPDNKSTNGKRRFGNSISSEAQKTYQNEAYFLGKIRNKRISVELLNQLLEEALESSNIATPYSLFLILEKWGEIAPVQGVEKLMSMPGGSELLPFLFSGWAKVDPESATEYFKKLKSDISTLDHANTAIQISEAYTLTAPKKAWEWLQEERKNLNPNTYNNCLNKFAHSLGANHPELIPQYVNELKFHEVETGWDWMGAAIAYFAEAWVNHSPNSWEWLNKLPDKYKAVAENQRILHESHGNLEEIEQKIIQLPAEAQSEARKELAIKMIRTGGLDMEKRADWAFNSSSEEKMDEALMDSMSTWMIEDSQTAETWLNSLPAGKKKEDLQKLYSTVHSEK